MTFQEYYATALRLGWFDACFYFDLLQSKGVSIRATDLSLFEHFATVGWPGGLSPSLRFSVTRYLAEYPDVAGKAVDPLYHYLVRGVREQRKAFALLEWPVEVEFAGLAESRRFARSVLESSSLPILFFCQGTGDVGQVPIWRLIESLGQAHDVECFAVVGGDAEPSAQCLGLRELDASGWSREQKADYLAGLVEGCGDLVVVSDSLATADLLGPFAARGHRIVSFLHEAPGPATPGATINEVKRTAHRIVVESDGLRDQISAAFAIPIYDIHVVQPPLEAAQSPAWERYAEDIGTCLRGLGNDGSRARSTGTTRGRQEVADDLCVVIPSYNHRDYIEAALDSILAQSLRPREIRIIDDGSTDGSADLLRSLESGKLGVSVRVRENRGASATINEGVADTSCPIVAVMNSDDIWHPLRIEQLIGELRQGGGADVVFSGLRFTGAQLRCTQKRDWYERGLADYRSGSPLWLVLMSFNLFFTTSNLIARRDKFLGAGGFGPLRYCHDLDYMLKTIAAGHEVRFVEQTLCDYRLHDRNTIDEDWAKVLFEDAWIIAKFLRRSGGRLGEEERLSVAKRVCAKGLAGRVRGMLAILARDPRPVDDATLHSDVRLAGIRGPEARDPVRPEELVRVMDQLVPTTAG